MSVKATGMITEIIEEIINDHAWIAGPAPRTVAMATAYQATDPTESALCIINLTSTAALTIGGGQTHAAEILIGPTAAVFTDPLATVVCQYRNSQTGGVVVGVALNSRLDMPCAFFLPQGWYFGPRVTSGTVLILSATDQSIG